MKVWILGAGGQLGCSLVDTCQSLAIPFVASKRSDVSITDLEELKKRGAKYKCTHIINCAAYTDVDRAETDSDLVYAVNAKGPEHLGIVARELGLSLVHVSTDYVFDGEKGGPYGEEDLPNPLGVYGKSKWEGELRLLAELPSACIVRTSWVFGKGGKNFISLALNLLQEREGLQAVEDQINRPTFHRDLALALLDLSNHSGVFHFANEGALSRYQILLDFFAAAQKREIPMRCKTISPVSFRAFPPLSPRPRNSVLSTEKVERALGRKPRMWQTVLSDYLDQVSLHGK